MKTIIETVTITNKSNNLKSVALTMGAAKVQLAKMLKNWRTDRGHEPFPYWIERCEEPKENHTLTCPACHSPYWNKPRRQKPKQP